MYWLGVAPEPLRREHLVPDKDEDFYIKEAANMLMRALNYSESSEVKTRALQISKTLSNEVKSIPDGPISYIVMACNAAAAAAAAGQHFQIYVIYYLHMYK